MARELNVNEDLITDQDLSRFTQGDIQVHSC